MITTRGNYSQAGFSLVEMAVVLVIVGLVVAGLMLPLTAQLDQRNYNATQKELLDLREALIGFAMSNSASDSRPYFPCPDITGDGLEDRLGAGGCSTAQGNVPWATLGLGQSDSWNNRYFYRVTAAFANSSVGFTFATPTDITILEAAVGNTLASNVPAVLLSKGKGAGAGADEQENSNDDAIFVSHTPTNLVGNEFDDLVVWVPSTVLFNRMVSAGKLP